MPWYPDRADGDSKSWILATHQRLIHNLTNPDLTVWVFLFLCVLIFALMKKNYRMMAAAAAIRGHFTDVREWEFK